MKKNFQNSRTIFIVIAIISTIAIGSNKDVQNIINSWVSGDDNGTTKTVETEPTSLVPGNNPELSITKTPQPSVFTPTPNMQAGENEEQNLNSADGDDPKKAEEMSLLAEKLTSEMPIHISQMERMSNSQGRVSPNDGFFAGNPELLEDIRRIFQIAEGPNAVENLRKIEGVPPFSIRGVSNESEKVGEFVPSELSVKAIEALDLAGWSIILIGDGFVEPNEHTFEELFGIDYIYRARYMNGGEIPADAVIDQYNYKILRGVAFGFDSDEYKNETEGLRRLEKYDPAFMNTFYLHAVIPDEAKAIYFPLDPNGNPDFRQVIVVSPGTTLGEFIDSFFSYYDVTQPNDREEIIPIMSYFFGANTVVQIP